MKPWHLVFAPPVVWSIAGLVLLFDGKRALDYFPYLWTGSDLAVMLAVAGVVLHFLRPGEPERPPVDEWTSSQATDLEGLPLEALLVELARRLEREAPLTSISRR